MARYCYYCYYGNTILESKMLNVYFETKMKNIPNKFEQWFKRRTWLEGQVFGLHFLDL